MKKAAIFLAMFFYTLTVHAQQHAPTLDVCRADEAVWGRASDQEEYIHAQAAFASRSEPNTTSAARLTMREIFARINEMTDCASVDPAPVRQSAYLAVMKFYGEVAGDRYRDFILRHHLWDQFMKEDDDGVR